MNFTPEQIAALEEWLIDRPPIVRELAYKYPPGTRFECGDEILWLVSYGEDGSVGVSHINPMEDYETAVATKQNLCGDCLSTYVLPDIY